MQMVWQSTESANGVTYDAGGTCVGLHVGFVFRKPIKIPSIRLEADVPEQVVMAVLTSA